MTSTFVLHNIGELITLAPLAKAGNATSVCEADLGIYQNAWLAVENGKISAYGSASDAPLPQIYQSFPKVDAHGQLILPGLVDCHTHPIFAGDRANEFCMRLDGATYQSIAAAGGGIQNTVKATRASSDENLLLSLEKRLQIFLSHGVTTVEVKSGYGLTIAEELRLLKILNRAKKTSNPNLHITCLALHAKSSDYQTAAAYADACTGELLDKIAVEKLASSVDAFVEKGYFESHEVRNFFLRARSLGLDVRIHADEFSDSGAAQLAADVKAASADHLQFSSSQGIRAMAAAKVTAVILPGTSLYTKIPFTGAKPFFEAGCAVAIGSDFNPGSCVADNLPMLMTVAAVHCGFSKAQALAAVTFAPACALGFGKSKGTLATGYDADLIALPLKNSSEFVADLGRTRPSRVWLAGISQTQFKETHT